MGRRNANSPTNAKPFSLGVTLDRHPGNQELILTIVFSTTSLSSEKVEKGNWNFEITQARNED
jgi:hypothetical protein